MVTLPNPFRDVVLGTATAEGSIQNEDLLLPTVSIAVASGVKAEGNSGPTAFTFTVSRTGDSSAGATVTYAITGTGPSPANASDYVGSVVPSRVVTFASGETSKTVVISIAGDAAVEPDNGFAVMLANPSVGLLIGMASASGTILNDDLKSHDDAYVILQGNSLTAAAAVGVLSNDESTPPATAALESGVLRGQLQLTADGGVSYTPTGNFGGD
jgi:hypothetical protein